MSELIEPEVFVVADNILSPLGKTTAENFAQLLQNKSGVTLHHLPKISAKPFFASLFDADETFITANTNHYTKFEQLLIASVSNALKNCNIDITAKDTMLIISSTKGNISLLENEPNTPQLQKRIALTTSASLVAAYFGSVNRPVVVSNACISGVLGLITGMRLLKSGQYKNAVVVGADVISNFIFSGFESFRALSPMPCKPFDKNRDGLNLGEGAAAVILSADVKHQQNIKIKGGSVSNDANHISGPSRTGAELAQAIKNAVNDAGVKPKDIDFISTHGTATVYNDEMEAKAIGLRGLQNVPLNSLKGYYGHTLGAAGLIETVVSLQSLKQGLILPTIGFNEIGVSSPVNVCSRQVGIKATNFLKTASGFGGCNAAVIFGE